MSEVATADVGESPVAAAVDVPLVVDLDGTLLKTDLLHETANAYLARAPWRLFRVAAWLAKGRAHLKERLAQGTTLDPSVLPLNQDVVAWLREEKRKGRTLVLATASNEAVARRVAAQVGLFDKVLASSSEENLKAGRKRDRLLAEFGPGGFDYVGDSSADLPVWEAARVAHLVHPARHIEERVRGKTAIGQVWRSRPHSLVSAILKVIRPHQWIKNALLFVPLLATHRYGDDGDVLRALLAFVTFCLTASSVYILNDLVDVEADRHHHRKCQRPLASGALSLGAGWALWPTLLVAAFTLGWLALPPVFMLTLGVYFALTLMYSLHLKQRPIIDVITLAGLYTLRIAAGAAMLEVPLSFWLLAFSVFLFLSLALIKRFSELKAARTTSRGSVPLRGRGYADSDLEIVASLGAAAGYVAVMVLALYIQDARTAQMYQSPQIIWLSCPLLLYWISRCWLLAHRGQMHDDPVVFAAKDKTSWLIVAGFVLTFALARMLELP